MSSELDAGFFNKRVTFRFMRQELRFDLSQSLFSSNDVDVGSRLLLKSVAQQVDGTAVTSLLDVGCGVGVLGLSLKKAWPHAAVTLQDRDALAVAVSAHNARLNKLPDVVVRGELGLEGLENGRSPFSLIVANLPGKAGEPVLRHLVRQMPDWVAPGGRTAVVIVKPLADMLRQAIEGSGSRILFWEQSTGYTVFHFDREAKVETKLADPLEPYFRARSTFKVADRSYTLQTVYNVPEFDTLAYSTTLTANILRATAVTDRVLFWNPGQGHLPVFLSQQAGPPITEFALAGRDLLSLRIAARNLAGQPVTMQHKGVITAVTAAYDWAIITPDDDPGVGYDRLLWPAFERLIKPGGNVVVTAVSAFIYRLLEQDMPSGWRVVENKKRHGFRALWLSREGA
jgi:SAM-dependent methyltransferase